jgi:tetratricopeptide (TPR) repeat protein
MAHRYISIVIILLVNFVVFSQEQPVTPQAALELFRQGDYEKAGEMYAELIKKYPKSSKYNYYLGICEMKTNRSISDAVKHLKYASVRGVSKDVYYYLGRAYQLNYNFKEAISAYERFLKYAGSDDVRKEKAEKYKKEAETGLAKSAKIYYLQVIDKDTVVKDRFLSLYHPVKDAGYIIPNRDFFESGVDPNGILYLTERKDEVYFSMPVDSTGQQDIFKMEKLIDGWSDPLNLKSVNSDYDDVYPYLQIDGVTLYFSSNREGGLGGYDIYKTVFDPDTKSFSDPVNMGIPFNSPKDDYFLVTDEFKGVAWFTSNRSTTGDHVMVYEIIWDKSVVKNMVYEENDVKIAATMPLLKDIPEKYRKLKQEHNYSGGSTGTKELFRFKVTNNVVYTDFNQFRSKEALAFFRKGYELQQKKDSLSDLMAAKRDLYAKAKMQDEKKKLVNEILALEKQVYSLDSKINDYYFNAKSIEKPIVEKLISEGRFKPVEPSHSKTERTNDLEGILIPKEYAYYTDGEFAKRLNRLEDMYRKLFPPETVAKLKYADSLYVWGNILNLESSKLLEQANSRAENKEIVISTVFNKNAEEAQTEEERTASLVMKGKELKNTALKLYHTALDKKFSIFSDKIKHVVMSHPTEDFTFLSERQAKANAYFRKAIEDMNNSITISPEQYERDGTLKREAVDLQQEGLFLYLDYMNGDTSVIDSVNIQDVAEQGQKRGQNGTVTKGNAVSSGVSDKGKDKVEYRIQIGVFKNPPSNQLLKELPPVSTLSIPEKGLTKYFCGHYSSLKEAQKHLPAVKNAGFKDSYVVAFYKGKVIKIEDALKISGDK